MILVCLRALLLGALLIATAVGAADGPRKIVLIGGTKSEGPGRHDYPNAIRVLDRLLTSSPDLQSIPGLVIEAHPDGWPRGFGTSMAPARWSGTSTVSTSIRCSRPSAAHDSRR